MTGTTATSTTFIGQNGHTYGFYSIATDTIGNVQPTPSSAQTTTRVDTLPPTSTVTALPTFNPGSFTVSWSGSDNTGGSGLATYSVFVSDNGGPFQPLETNTTSTSTTFIGQNGHSYGFYSIATDKAGNAQSTPTVAQVTTTVDTTPPTSSVTALPAFSPGNFTVSWLGSDNTGGSGIATYSVFVSDDGGPYQPIETNTTLTFTPFTGQNGHTYGFYSIATDNVGNVQSTPSSAQTTTTVDTVLPTSSVTALPAFSPGRLTVSWSGTDNAGGSGINSYSVFVSDNGGPFKSIETNTTATSTTFTGQNGHTYGFYSIATDKAGNVQSTPSSAQTTTTVDALPPTSGVTALPTFSPGSFTVSWSGSDNSGGSGLATFSVFLSDNGGTFLPIETNTTLTSTTFTGQNGHSYGFYSIATDNVGNVQLTPSSAQATTKVDTILPTSSVTALPAFSPGSFMLSWSGSDNTGGSGINSYSIFVSDNGGSYQSIESNTTSISTTFTGQNGHTYGFYSIATDNAGNVQSTPSSSQATTTVDAIPPTSSVSALPLFSPSSFTLSWSGADNASGSGISTYSVFVSDNGAAFQPVVTDTFATSTTFFGDNGHTYGFYSVATDNAGNVQSTTDSEQTTTTVDIFPPTSSVTALPAISPGSFTLSWSGADNLGGSGLANYSVFVSDNGGSFQPIETNTTATSTTFTGRTATPTASTASPPTRPATSSPLPDRAGEHDRGHRGTDQ